MTKTSHPTDQAVSVSRMFGVPNLSPFCCKLRPGCASPASLTRSSTLPIPARRQRASCRSSKKPWPPHRRYLAHRGSLGADPRGRKQKFWVWEAANVRPDHQSVNRRAEEDHCSRCQPRSARCRKLLERSSRLRRRCSENWYPCRQLLQEGPYQALVTDQFVPPWPGLESIRS